MTKRILCMLLCGVFLTMSAMTATAIRFSSALGDANGDGRCSAIDFVMIKRHVLKTYEINETYLSNADINKDGRLNTADYVLAKRIVMKTYVPPVQDTVPDENTVAVLTLSLLLKDGNQEELALLEGVFDLSVSEMNNIVVKYLTTLSADDETLEKWEGSISVPKEDLEKLALSIKDILLQIQAEQMQ